MTKPNENILCCGLLNDLTSQFANEIFLIIIFEKRFQDWKKFDKCLKLKSKIIFVHMLKLRDT